MPEVPRTRSPPFRFNRFVPVALADALMPFAVNVPPLMLIVWSLEVLPTRTWHVALNAAVSWMMNVLGPFQCPNMMEAWLESTSLVPVTFTTELSLSMNVALRPAAPWESTKDCGFSVFTPVVMTDWPATMYVAAPTPRLFE